MTATVSSADLPLTMKEQGQWMLHRLTPGRGICNLGMALRSENHMRWWPLQETLNHLLRRHQALRATLRLGGASARKRFLPEDIALPLETVASTEDKLDDVLGGFTAEPFDVDGQLLARAYLVLLPHGSVFCLVLHHLVADYTSFNILLSEFTELYEVYADGVAVPDRLDGPAQLHLEADPDQSTVDYWVRHLDGADPAAMPLATARPVPNRPSFAGEILEYQLSEEGNAAVETLRARTRLTTNIVMLSAFYAILAQHGAGPDLVVGVPVNGRRARNRDAVGFHANTLPIRVAVDQDIDFAELADRTSKSFLVGLEHAAASFESVQFALGNRSGDWRAPLFRHMFNFRPASRDMPAVGGSRLRGIDVRRSLSRLDVEWEIWPKTRGVQLFARYSTEVHDRADMIAMLERYDALLVELARADTDRPLSSISCWTDADRAAHCAFNDTARIWPQGTTLDAVRAVAAQRPEAVAVHAEGVDHDYADLLGAAGGVAAALAEAGIQAGDVVGLYAGRGTALASAVLGVWSLGAAYLPLDPGHPAARLADQLDDAGVSVVVAGEPLPDGCATGRSTVDLVAACAEPARLPGDSAPGPDDLAYVIYTSGSTGRPKGVELTHGNLVNVVRHFAAELALGPEDRMLWLTTFSFDISALELLLPLITGGRIVVAPDEARLRGADLLRVIEDEGVTVVQATPTTWRQLAPELGARLPGLRMLTGGEAITATLANTLLDADRDLVNVYGPTETTIWSTSAALHAPVPDRVSIGTPIANNTVHVLDESGRQVPPGVPGELCIGGTGVARGYRGRPELTGERFRTGLDIGRYYRTGDLARFTPTGLEFLGRTDRQVKVRGHRIELGEVESVLDEHADVAASAVVLSTGPDGNGRLVAAVRLVPDVAGMLAPEELADRLRTHAANRLAGASVPALFLELAEFPLTGNGKVDNRAIATLLSGSGEPTALPDDPLLRILVSAWRTVLGVDTLGVDANFFLSGGHSLLAATLAERVGTELEIELDFALIFAEPTPRRLADLLRAEVLDSREG